MTQGYVAHRRVMTQRYVVHTAKPCLGTMLHTVKSRLCAMQVNIYLSISLQNRNRIQKYFRLFIRALGTIDLWKNGGRKSRGTVSLSKSFSPIYCLSPLKISL
jgi:hypothetical protein